MSQKLKLRVKNYIAKTKKVLEELRLSKPFQPIDNNLIDEFMDHVRRYVKDAEFYHEKGDFETALASICYCEGLLDALRLFGIAEFKWPLNKEL